MVPDVDTDFYAWMESLEPAAEPESKLWKDDIAMDDNFRQLVSSSTVCKIKSISCQDIL